MIVLAVACSPDQGAARYGGGPTMLHSILGFLMQLSMLYLLTGMFVILDLLLLSVRIRRLRYEKLVRQRKDAARQAEQRRDRESFEQRQPRLA